LKAEQGDSVRFVIAHELIGLRCEVMESPNRFEVGLAGEIVDETMRTLVIQTENGMKRIPKHGRTFGVWYKGHKLKLSGNLIEYRPEDRIKRGIMLIKRQKGNLREKCRR
jgi:ribonuclease P protein subunit POP4